MAVFILVLALLAPTVSCHKYFSPFDFLEYKKASVQIDPAITLTVTPGVLNKSGDWVDVTWSGVSNPSTKDDWIGVYAPPTNGNTVNPQTQAPVKYQYCSLSPTHSSGKGSLKFRLVNVRAPYIFALLRGGFEKPTVAAVSNTVEFTNYNEPLQGHLALTDDPSKINLIWVTRDSNRPQAKWWENLTTYIRIENATTTSYSATDMCGAPATTIGYIDPGVLHMVTMNGLTPGHVYNYQFGDDSYGWSPVYSFKVPPKSDPNTGINIIAFGDMGEAQSDGSLQPIRSQVPSLKTTRLIESDMHMIDLVLHIGDISYARGYAGVWDEFFDLIQPISTQVPYMVCIGNHERDFPNSGSFYEGTDSGGECGIPYNKRFLMPRPGPDQDWYDFVVGNVHVIVMSTEHNFTVGSTQYMWLQKHLSMVNREVTPWLIFAGHRPMYVDSLNNAIPGGDIPVAKALQQNVEPLLMQYKVDLAIWGHHHSYQRTCPVYQEKCVSGAPVHMVIGMAGQGLSKDIHILKPKWIDYVDCEHYGYTRIITTPDILTVEYVRDDDGKVHDTLVLKKT